jgi:hypothetical protein
MTDCRDGANDGNNQIDDIVRESGKVLLFERTVPADVE